LYIKILKSVKVNIIFFFSFCLLLSCNSLKNVKKGEYILVSNKFVKDGKLLKKKELDILVLKKPNNKVLGIPLGLHIYNLAETSPDSIFDDWLNTKNRKKKWEKFISKKQVYQLRDYKIDFNNWIKNLGAPPSIISQNEIKNTKNILEQYYKNQGYFNNQVAVKVDTIGKKVAVLYDIKTKNRYVLDTISHVIASPYITEIYQDKLINSFLKRDTPFSIDNFEKERLRIVDIFKNNGVYDFQQNSIQYTLSIDTIGFDYKIPVKINIYNKQIRRGDSIIQVPYNVYTISKVKIFIQSLNPKLKSSPYLDSIFYNNTQFYTKEKLKYNPQLIKSAIAIKEGELYSDKDRKDTYKSFLNLLTFKYPSIIYSPDPLKKNGLITSIFLEPKDRFSLNFDIDGIHSNIQTLGISLRTSLLTRNIFRGSEILEIATTGTMAASSDINLAQDRFFNIFEAGVNMKLYFPRILFFSKNKSNLYKNTPNTEFLLGTSLQQNIGLDRQYFNFSASYNWKFSSTKELSLKWLDWEYVINQNVSNYFNVYRNSYNNLNTIAQNYNLNTQWVDENNNLLIPNGTDNFINATLNNIGNINIDPNGVDYQNISIINQRKQRIITNNLISAFSLSYDINNKDLLYKNAFQLGLKLEIAGNFLTLLADIINKDKNENNRYEYFGVEHSQYIKMQLNYIKYWHIGDDKLFAFRFFSGIAIPNGNSNSIPFSKSYFAGGANDNRAWRVYKLGPGVSQNFNEFNEANFKLAFNLEYRYSLIGKMHGAFFIDAGNIWNFNDNVSNSESRFDGIHDLEEIAIGSGFGLRYDFKFLILRLDLGFKTYDPTLPVDRRWWTQFSFKDSLLNIGINYPF